MEMIVAVYDDWGIGYEGKQSIVLKADRKFFREKTMDSVVIVGRNTFYTFPEKKPLPGRTNVVMTSRSQFVNLRDCLICDSINTALELDRITGKCIVIGGERVYKQFLPFCERVYVTKVHTVVKSDKHFPNLDNLEWWTSRKIKSGSENGISYEIFVYENIKTLDRS